MATLWGNFLAGTITNNPLASGGTTINSAEFASLPTVTAPDVMWIVLDPRSLAAGREIVQVTAHTASATSVTVTRAQQSTSAQTHTSGTEWIVGVTKSDMESWLPKAGGTMTGVLLLPSGSQSAPSVAPSGDPDTGMYSYGTNQLGFTAGGTNRAFLDSTGLTLAGALIAAVARSDAAMTAAKVDGTAVSGGIYALRISSTSLSASNPTIAYATAGSEATLLTINVTTVRANAIVLVAAMAEYQITSAGTGILVFGCEFDGSASTHNIDVSMAATTSRDNRTRVWTGTFTSAGAHTIDLVTRKTVNDGAANAMDVNTVMIALIME